MKRIHILHVTDFHCKKSTGGMVDGAKDKGLSSGLVGEILGEGLLARFNRFVKRISIENPIDVIAFTGDLGMASDEDTLALGIEYLHVLAKDTGVSPKYVVVCPGNHDLNRKASHGNELDKFCEYCKSKGFSFSERTEPAIIDHFGPPIIVLNSCLGGTEHAKFGDLPEQFWISVKKTIKDLEDKLATDDIISKMQKEWQDQVIDLDVPALGYDQIDKAAEALALSEGNCSVIIMHHNLLPTRIIIRPYATLIDASRLLQYLSERGRRVVLLHGHTHCDSGFSVFPHQEDKGGFVASIGSRGFFDESNAAANLIEINLTSDNNYIRSKVSLITRPRDDFQCRFQYVLYNRNRNRDTDDFEATIKDALKHNVVYTFADVAARLGKNADDSLAEKLIQLDPDPLDITGTYTDDLNNWRISRIR